MGDLTRLFFFVLGLIFSLALPSSSLVDLAGGASGEVQIREEALGCRPASGGRSSGLLGVNSTVARGACFLVGVLLSQVLNEGERARISSVGGGESAF